MERDFLGVIGKESGAMSKDEGRSNPQDSVFYGNGSGMQWSSSNKGSPLPPYMSIKKIREEKSDQFSISGFQPKPDNFNPPPRTSAPMITQQYAVHGYGSPVQNTNGSRVFPVMSHHSVPFTQSSPFVKVSNSPPSSQNVAVAPVRQQPNSGGLNLHGHLVGSTVGVFAQRDAPKFSPAAQMTIFYAGSVCSFDNIPVDKAREILMLASKAANVTSPVIEPPKVETLAKIVDAESSRNSNPMQAQKQSPVIVTPSCQVASTPVSIQVTPSPVSVVSHAAALSRSASSSNNSDSNMPKSLSPLGPSSQPEPSSSLPSKLNTSASPAVSGSSANLTTGLGTAAGLPAGLSTATAAAIVPRAVPQARKASLARFLERRKERVGCTPYSKLSEKGDLCQSNNSLIPKSSTGVDQSRNCDDSFSLGQSNNTSYTNDAPSTELQI